MSIYDKNAEMALTLIKKKGTKLTFTRVSGSYVDVVTGSVTKTTETGEFFAVVLPATTTGVQISTGFADNRYAEDLRAGKMRYILAAAKDTLFTPDVSNTTVFEGSTWEVIGSATLAPDGTPIIFKIGVRKI